MLLGFRWLARLRFELFEPSLTLCDDPWNVSPLRAVLSGLWDDESAEAVEGGSSRLARFRRDCTSETEVLSFPGRFSPGWSGVDGPREEDEVGIRRREEVDEALRSAGQRVSN